MRYINFRNILIIVSCFLLTHISVYASTFNYITKVDGQVESQLISMGDTLLRALYQNQDLNQFTVFPLFTTSQGKQSVFSKLKKADLSILTKKSKGSEEEKDDRREMLAKIIAMMWKIYDIGRKQGEDAALSSSYKLIDPQGKLYNYLKNYVTLANQQASVFAYDRDPKKNKSSHYKKVSPEGQWGIDVRFYANQSSLKLLPNARPHCLFGRLAIDPNQPNLLFIKFEDQGIAAPSEIIGHGISYLKSQMRSAKEKANTRIEKTIRPEIIQKYLDIVNQLTPQEQAKFNTDNADTVRDILLTAQAIAQTLPKLKAAQESLMQTANSIYPNDHEFIWDRTGNEIIFEQWQKFVSTCVDYKIRKWFNHDNAK